MKIRKVTVLLGICALVTISTISLKYAVIITLLMPFARIGIRRDIKDPSVQFALGWGLACIAGLVPLLCGASIIAVGASIFLWGYLNTHSLFDLVTATSMRSQTNAARNNQPHTVEYDERTIHIRPSADTEIIDV